VTVTGFRERCPSVKIFRFKDIQMFSGILRLGIVVTLALAAVPLRAEIIEQILVKVNGEIITRSDFEKRQMEALKARPELAKLPPTSPQLAQAVAEATPTVILDAIDDLLMLQRAHEHGWALSAEQTNRIIGDIRKSNNLEDDAVFKKALEAEGYTEAELRKNIERDVLIRQVRQVDVIEKLNVTDEEIRNYYDLHAREFTSPAEVTLREIVIAVPASDRGINVAQQEAAQEQANQLRARLLAGEPFAKLAGELSSSGSKSNGGLVGTLRLDDLSEDRQQAIAGLKIGGISEVLRTNRGYEIFLLEARSETKVKTLDEARGEVSRRIADEKSVGATLKYVEKLREQAKIDFRNDELKRAYEKALADRREAAARELAKS
jgi:peptidyl-prolyl cis-trans isomerase SurA